MPGSHGSKVTSVPPTHDPGGVTHEHGPARSTRLHERPVELGDELGIDDHVTDIEVLPRRGLHDVVKRRGVGAEMLGIDAVDHLQSVAEIRALVPARRPALDHRPVDVGQHQLARAVHPGDAGADPAREARRRPVPRRTSTT